MIGQVMPCQRHGMEMSVNSGNNDQMGRRARLTFSKSCAYID